MKIIYFKKHGINQIKCTKHFGGGGYTQVVFKKNKLLGKTTQNIGKEFKKKRTIYKLLAHNLDRK